MCSNLKELQILALVLHHFSLQNKVQWGLYFVPEAQLLGGC